MKLLTTNFVQCAVKSCSSSSNCFPLHFTECELVHEDLEFDEDFIKNVMVKIDWPALLSVTRDIGHNSLPEEKPNIDS